MQYVNLNKCRSKKEKISAFIVSIQERHFLSLCLQVSTDVESLTDCGRGFQSSGAATAKERPP